MKVIRDHLVKVDKANLSVLFDTVRIELVCKDEYQAQVLFEDISQRLQAGEEMSFKSVKPE